MASSMRFGRQFARKFSSNHNPENVEKTAKMWEKITLFIGFPAVIVGTINSYMTHHTERVKFIPYEYMYFKTKPFPWGDGNRPFFYNPKVNALPTGYEDEQ